MKLMRESSITFDCAGEGVASKSSGSKQDMTTVRSTINRQTSHRLAALGLADYMCLGVWVCVCVCTVCIYIIDNIGTHTYVCMYAYLCIDMCIDCTYRYGREFVLCNKPNLNRFLDCVYV